MCILLSFTDCMFHGSSDYLCHYADNPHFLDVEIREEDDRVTQSALVKSFKHAKCIREQRMGAKAIWKSTTEEKEGVGVTDTG